MRLSNFVIKLIWFIVLTTAVIVSFQFDVKIGYRLQLGPMFGRIFSIMIFLMWSVGLSETLTDVIVFKYKIVEGIWDFEAEYLTLIWLIIPRWKPINEKYHGYEGQNIFGATIYSSYMTNITYKTKDIALEAIEEHKEQIKKNRKNWFKTPESKKKKTTYL